MVRSNPACSGQAAPRYARLARRLRCCWARGKGSGKSGGEAASRGRKRARREALRRTLERRPELLESADLSDEDRRWLAELGWNPKGN